MLVVKSCVELLRSCGLNSLVAVSENPAFCMDFKLPTTLIKHWNLQHPLYILFINETRLDDSVSDDEVYIPGYDIIRRDREHNGRLGGGVYIYVRSYINFSLRPDLSDIHLENLCIEIRKPRSKPFLIVTRYRPPNSSTEIFSHFESFVGKLRRL